MSYYTTHIKNVMCEDVSLFHFHTKTTERIEMKSYNNILYTSEFRYIGHNLCKNVILS